MVAAAASMETFAPRRGGAAGANATRTVGAAINTDSAIS